MEGGRLGTHCGDRAPGGQPACAHRGGLTCMPLLGGYSTWYVAATTSHQREEHQNNDTVLKDPPHLGMQMVYSSITVNN